MVQLYNNINMFTRLTVRFAIAQKDREIIGGLSLLVAKSTPPGKTVSPFPILAKSLLSIEATFASLIQ